MFGPDHHETLVAKQTLGESRYLQGRISDASQLQEEAVDGLTKLFGVEHEDTLIAMDSHGRTLQIFRTEEAFRRARKLHLTAVKGMRELYGDRHLRTLRAREDESPDDTTRGEEHGQAQASGLHVPSGQEETWLADGSLGALWLIDISDRVVAGDEGCETLDMKVSVPVPCKAVSKPILKKRMRSWWMSSSFGRKIWAKSIHILCWQW